jgi:hypothetical protein
MAKAPRRRKQAEAPPQASRRRQEKDRDVGSLTASFRGTGTRIPCEHI